MTNSITAPGGGGGRGDCVITCLQGPGHQSRSEVGLLTKVLFFFRRTAETVVIDVTRDEKQSC